MAACRRASPRCRPISICCRRNSAASTTDRDLEDGVAGIPPRWMARRLNHFQPIMLNPVGASPEARQPIGERRMRKFAFFAGILSVCLVAWPGLIRAAGVNQLNQPLLLDSFRNQPFGGFDLTSPSQESAKGELTPQQIAAANAALHLAAQALEKHDLDTAKAKFAEAA